MMIGIGIRDLGIISSNTATFTLHIKNLVEKIRDKIWWVLRVFGRWSALSCWPFRSLLLEYCCQPGIHGRQKIYNLSKPLNIRSQKKSPKYSIKLLGKKMWRMPHVIIRHLTLMSNNCCYHLSSPSTRKHIITATLQQALPHAILFASNAIADALLQTIALLPGHSHLIFMAWRLLCICATENLHLDI